MRNLIGGIIGVLIGSTILVVIAGLQDPLLSWPYNMIWFIFSGSNALRLSIDGFLNSDVFLGYILTWLLIGVVVGLFSKKGWNTIRTVLWVGLILGIFSLTAVLLQDAGYWTAPTRNIELFYHFVGSIVVSLCALPSAVPTTVLLERLARQAEEPIPVRIGTTCECGAVFKSNPIICSECGRQLREVED